MANRLSLANLVARSAAFARALAQRNPRLSPFRQREGGAMSAARFAPLTLLAALAVAAAPVRDLRLSGLRPGGSGAG